MEGNSVSGRTDKTLSQIVHPTATLVSGIESEKESESVRGIGNERETVKKIEIAKGKESVIASEIETEIESVPRESASETERGIGSETELESMIESENENARGTSAEAGMIVTIEAKKTAKDETKDRVLTKEIGLGIVNGTVKGSVGSDAVVREIAALCLRTKIVTKTAMSGTGSEKPVRHGVRLSRDAVILNNATRAVGLSELMVSRERKAQLTRAVVNSSLLCGKKRLHN